MLLLVSDENFNGDIVRGLLRRNPTLDLVRVQDVGLMQTPDEKILEWAAAKGRILVTHDISTVPPLAHQRVATGKPMPGVFIVSDRIPISQVIEELLFLALETESHEWNNQAFYLPI
jgi:predicted nuclease of predicted toxin-antitoxin system